MESLRIGVHDIGPGHPCFVVAEVGLGHEGSLGMAHAYIDAIADGGAQAVKFQMHIAAEESTPAEAFRVRVFPQDATRYDYWQRTAFSEEEWEGLVAHARERGLVFLCSPFSVRAVDLLEQLGVPAWKISSGEVSTDPILDAACATRKPVLLSTGMSPWSEIDRCVARVRERGNPLLLYQCSSRYPCPPEAVGLNLLEACRSRYAIPVGLSDHSGEVACGLGACALGADSVEVHVTFHRACFGPDVPASLTLEELGQLTRGASFLHQALQHPVDKDADAGQLAPLRDLFMKSVVLRQDVAAGTVLTEAMLTVKKPGTGIPAAELSALVGRRAARDLACDELLTWDALTDG